MKKREIIILKTIDYKENSKIVHYYSEDGKLSFISKGVKKQKNSTKGILQSLNLTEIITIEAKLPILVNIDLVNDFKKIKNNLESQLYSTHILEVINTLSIDNIQHLKVYLLLKKILIKINDGFNPELLSFIFELKFLHFIGLGLNFDNLDMFDKDSELYSLVKKLYFIKIDQIQDKKIKLNKNKEIRHFIDFIYMNYLDFKTKTRNVIEKVYNY